MMGFVSFIFCIMFCNVYHNKYITDMADSYTDASTEAANIATYYFKHQSDAEVNENIVDHDSDAKESLCITPSRKFNFLQQRQRR